MSVQIDQVKNFLDKSLQDKSKPWFQAFDFLESKTGVSRVHLFAGKKFSYSLLFLVILNWIHQQSITYNSMRHFALLAKCFPRVSGFIQIYCVWKSC